MKSLRKEIHEEIQRLQGTGGELSRQLKLAADAVGLINNTASDDHQSPAMTRQRGRWGGILRARATESGRRERRGRFLCSTEEQRVGWPIGVLLVGGAIRRSPGFECCIKFIRRGAGLGGRMVGWHRHPHPRSPGHRLTHREQRADRVFTRRPNAFYSRFSATGGTIPGCSRVRLRVAVPETRARRPRTRTGLRNRHHHAIRRPLRRLRECATWPHRPRGCRRCNDDLPVSTAATSGSLGESGGN